MQINIKTIPHDQQRYPTVGDWQWNADKTKLDIRVSEMPDIRYVFLVIIHELVEVFLCHISNVSQHDVDEFDMAFEKNRGQYDFDEPGDHPEAPYRTQHCIATGVERVCASVMGVSWKEYEECLNAL